GTKGGAGCCDHGHFSADQIGHQCRQAIVLALQPVVLDRYVLAFDVAGLVQAFAERAQIARGGIGRKASNNPDHRLRRLLRARRERQRDCRAAKERDELAPPHLLPLIPRIATYHTAVGTTPLCVRANLESLCLLWVTTGHSAMSAQCPVCAKADTAGRFMSTRPSTRAKVEGGQSPHPTAWPLRWSEPLQEKIRR